MKKRLNTAAFLLLLLLSGISAAAGDPAANKIADGAAPFVNEGTVAVAHVDMTSLDLPAVESFLNDSIKSSSFPKEEREEVTADLHETMTRMAQWVGDFRKAGGKEIYAIVDLQSITSGSPPRVIVPLDTAAGEKADSKAIVNLLETGKLESPPAPAVRGKHQPTSRVVGNAVVFYAEGVAEEAENFVPLARPDLAIALQGVPAGSIQVAFFPPDEARKMVETALPQLPAELGGGAVTALTQGLRSAALSAALPPHEGMHLLIQAKDAESAQRLSRLRDAGLEMVRKEAECHKDAAPMVSLLDILKPQIKGDRLELSLDHDSFGALAAPIAMSMHSARLQARRVESMSNMRQILVGMIMFADDNKGSFPDTLDAVAGYLGNDQATLDRIFTDPENPRHKPGFVYVKPARKMAEIKDPSSTVVLYQSITRWKGGINVGFADGHCEFINDREKFNKMVNIRVD